MITAIPLNRPLLAPPNGSDADHLPAAIRPLVAIVRQLAEVVEAMTDQQYTTKPVGVVPSSIGGHVRHCLDHVDALLAGIERGAIDYDQRQRGTAIETSRQAALDAMRRQEWQLLALARYPEDHPLRLSVMLTSSQSPLRVETSLGRELAFVLSHTIHHNALIGVMAKLMGLPVPDRFGYAPSTLAYLQKAVCAP